MDPIFGALVPSEPRCETCDGHGAPCTVGFLKSTHIDAPSTLRTWRCSNGHTLVTVTREDDMAPTTGTLHNNPTNWEVAPVKLNIQAWMDLADQHAEILARYHTFLLRHVEAYSPELIDDLVSIFAQRLARPARASE